MTMSVDLARVDILQTDVGVDRGLDVAVAEKLSDDLVLARAGLEKESACGVPELMHRHPQPGRLVDPLRDLATQQDVAFCASVLTREQPVLVPATEQERPEVVDIVVDHSREVGLQGIFQPDPVLDVVVGEGQPIIRVSPAGLDQVGPELDGRKIKVDELDTVGEIDAKPVALSKASRF